MDDQRDYEEERAQEAAQKEEQEAELTASVDAENEEVMLWQIGSVDFTAVLEDIIDFTRFARRRINEARRMIAAGAPDDLGEVTVTLSAWDAQALSVGLNLAGLFVPEIRDEAETLMRRLAAERDKYEATEEQKAKVRAAFQTLQDEDMAEMMGVPVEELKDMKERILEKLSSEAEPVIEVDAGVEPNLN